MLFILRYFWWSSYFRCNLLLWFNEGGGSFWVFGGYKFFLANFARENWLFSLISIGIEVGFDSFWRFVFRNNFGLYLCFGGCLKKLLCCVEDLFDIVVDIIKGWLSLLEFRLHILQFEGSFVSI